MISVSGIRGIVGSGLTPELIVQYVAALGTAFGPGQVYVGRDSRTSGEMVRSAVFSALISVGCDPVDLGVCSTPTVEFAVQESDAVAGVVISASHNPVEWNALKLLDSSGLFLDKDEGARISRIVEERSFQYTNWEGLGVPGSYKHAVEDHISAVLRIPYLDLAAIRKRRFRVVYDCVNGAGATILPDLFDALGCDTHPLNLEPHGHFAHTPEPTPANIEELCKWVRETGSHVGFAVDPDVDRLAIVSEKGDPLGEEYTIVLAASLILSKKKGPVVVNVSTTRAVQDVCRSSDVECLQTPVGESHVVSRMKEVDAVVGGEGNGGVILPDVHPGRDAPVAIALTLQHLTEFNGPLSALWDSMPRYSMTKQKIEIGNVDLDQLIEQLEKAHRGDEFNRIDGLRIDSDDGWVHIRKSNTEPIIRVITEASHLERAKSLSEDTVKQIRALM